MIPYDCWRRAGLRESDQNGLSCLFTLASPNDPNEAQTWQGKGTGFGYAGSQFEPIEICEKLRCVASNVARVVDPAEEQISEIWRRDQKRVQWEQPGRGTVGHQSHADLLACHLIDPVRENSGHSVTRLRKLKSETAFMPGTVSMFTF